MGIIISKKEFEIVLAQEADAGANSDNKDNDPASKSKTLSTDNLRLEHSYVIKLMELFERFQYPPMIDYMSLCLMIQNAGNGRELSDQASDLIAVLWHIFQIKSICYIHEVLATLIVLSEASWYDRLSLLFDLFKGIGLPEVNYDDIVMAVEVVAVALCRVWGVAKWQQSELNVLAEGLADSAIVKLEKELDDGIVKEEFMKWAQERFKSSRTIASPEALRKILISPFD